MLVERCFVWSPNNHFKDEVLYSSVRAFSWSANVVE